jgi:hypothetical protein
MSTYEVRNPQSASVLCDSVPVFVTRDVARGLACTRLLIASICLLPWAGCQSSPVSRLDPASPENCPFSRTQSQVAVAVWPWTNHGEVNKQFGVDLLSEHILPVQIVIANRGEETIRFSSTQVELMYGDSLGQPVLSEGEMTRRTQKNTTTAPWLIYVGTLGLGAPISGVMGVSLENDNLRTRQLRQETYLSTVTLDGREAMSGFLFFDIPSEIRFKRDSPLNGTVVIRRLPMSSGGTLAFNIPVSIE